MPFYSPPVPFQTSQIVHHPHFPQNEQIDEDNKPHEQQSQRWSRRLRRRHPCDIKGHI